MRLTGQTDARNGTTSYAYNGADWVTNVVTPAPGAGQAAQQTQTVYDAQGRVWLTRLPDGAWQTNQYSLTGELQLQTGSRTYPVGYGYDSQGRLTSMTNWASFSSGAGARVTTWSYDSQRGWLSAKRYPDSTGPDYTNTAGGRLKTRTWARGTPRMVTTYAYGFEGADPNAKHGDLVGTTYTNDPAGAPAVTLVYDRLGRLQTATQNGFTNTLAYNYASQLLSESYSGGPLGGRMVENQYDGYLRRTTNQVRLTTGSPLAAVAYGYSQTSGWLDTVSSGNYAAGYSYVANSPLVSQINFKQGSVVKMTTAKAYDPVSQQTAIQSAVAGANQLPQAFAY